VIRPQRGWTAALNLGEIWEYRDLLFTFGTRDVKLRYRQTALGVAWVVLHPLIAAGIFSIIFGMIAGVKTGEVPIFVFTFAGMTAWNLFANTLSKCSMSMISHGHLVSKVFFPRLILPTAQVFGVLIDTGVSLALLAVMMAAFRVAPHAGLLLLPVFLLLLLLLSLGVGLIAAGLTVRYRDVQHVTPVLMQVLLYASAVQYPLAVVLERVPPVYRPLFLGNPLAALIEGFRWSLVGHGTLRWDLTLGAAIFSVVVFAAGLLSFKNLERQFADVI
jgi:lipopolysaccharide transport system permease protein